MLCKPSERPSKRIVKLAARTLGKKRGVYARPGVKSLEGSVLRSAVNRKQGRKRATKRYSKRG